MPLYSATSPLPINMERRRTFNPSRTSGLQLWLKADAGLTTTPEPFISQIILTGAGTTTSNGTYIRTAGDTTFFTSGSANAINFEEMDGGNYVFFVYDDDIQDTTYSLLISNTQILSINLSNGSAPVPSASITLSSGTRLQVTGWADQSGNSHNAVNENGDTPPILVSNAVNGKPAIEFNNLATSGLSFMRITAPALNLKSSTAFFVVKQDEQINFARFFSFLSATGEDYDSNDGLAVLYNNTSDPRQFQITSSFIDAIENNSVYENFGIASYTISSDGTINPFFNSVSGTSGQNTDMASSNGADALIGQGSQLVSGSDFDGKIAEIVIYNRVLTTGERQQVESYLNSKYAIY